MLHLKTIVGLFAQLLLIAHSRSLDRAAKAASRRALAGVLALLGPLSRPAIAAAEEVPALPSPDAHDEALALLGIEPTPTIELGIDDIEVIETSNVYDWIEPAPDPVFET